MYIKKKLVKGFLDSLEEKNSFKVIGVVGCSKGDGVTTMSIAMANYLAEIMSAKTAIVECNNTNTFEVMGNMFLAREECKNNYVIGKVTYFFGISLNEFFATYANVYEYVIVDFGNNGKDFKENALKLKYKIILGSVMPYKYTYHQEFVKYIENEISTEQCLHILDGDEKNVKDYSNKNKINGLPCPYIANPYIIESKLANFFQLLF